MGVGERLGRSAPLRVAAKRGDGRNGCATGRWLFDAVERLVRSNQQAIAVGDGAGIEGAAVAEVVDGELLELSVRLSPDNWARFQALESA